MNVLVGHKWHDKNVTLKRMSDKNQLTLGGITANFLKTMAKRGVNMPGTEPAK